MKGRIAISSWDTPVYNAIRAYIGSGMLPFHMPGHKLGKGIPDVFMSEIEKLDLTEIPGLDDLHKPEGILKRAQELAAIAFGARKSYFLVNGSTVGLHAAISAVCKSGQRIIAGRDSHSSVIGGMLMAGAMPYYIMPEFSRTLCINTAISPQEVERALCAVPEAPAVLITRPNYYGVCCDIAKIAKIVHAHDKILIVDEAHGPHLAFNKRLPVCALEAGADICIQSAHKTLPAFSQSAYLHTGSQRVDTERLEYFLDIYQTTSPSYILMSFLDIAREIMHKQGEQLLDRLLDSIEEHRNRLRNGEILLLDKNSVPGFEHDATRLTLNVSRLGITGCDAEELLREKCNIQAEMSDLDNIVFISTVSDSPDDIGQLFSAFDWLSDNAAGANTRHTDLYDRYADLLRRQAEISVRQMEPAAIIDSGVERVRLVNAVGRISKCTISPYPPGTAIVCPGEEITAEAVAYLMDVIRAGGRTHGINGDGTVCVLDKL